MDDKVNSGKKGSILPWIIVGVLLLAVIGGGIYAFTSLNKPAASAQAASAQGQGQSQGRRGAFTQNPAMRAAMDIMRLQRDQQQKLTAAQITTLKPILQKLVDTTNPSQDFLQQQADAITAVFTAAQKTFLNQRPSGFQGRPNGGYSGGANGGTPNGGGTGGAQNGSGTDSGTNGGYYGNGGARFGGGSGTGNGQRRSFNPQDLYKQVLDSLK